MVLNGTSDLKGLQKQLREGLGLGSFVSEIEMCTLLCYIGSIFNSYSTRNGSISQFL